MTRTADQKRRIRAGTSAAMRRLAEKRQCPKCKRKMALSHHRDSAGRIIFSVCRWCDYEKARE